MTCHRHDLPPGDMRLRIRRSGLFRTEREGEFSPPLSSPDVDGPVPMSITPATWSSMFASSV